MLFLCVYSYLFLVNDNISINKYVIEEEKLSCFRLFSAHLGEDSFSNKYPARHCKWLRINVTKIFLIIHSIKGGQ